MRDVFPLRPVADSCVRGDDAAYLVPTMKQDLGALDRQASFSNDETAKVIRSTNRFHGPRTPARQMASDSAESNEIYTSSDFSSEDRKMTSKARLSLLPDF